MRWKQDIHGIVSKVHVINTKRTKMDVNLKKERDDTNSTEVVLELVKL